MTANFWRIVLGTQLALAVGLGLLFRALLPEAGIALAGLAGAGAFAALQYLLVAAMGRASGPTNVAPGEPLFLAMAELSMAFKLRPRATHSGPATRGPLLLVHGFACNSGVWHWLTPALRATGYGPIRAVDLETLAADLDSLARALARELTEFHRAQGNEPVTVLAHSMGGIVCRAALREVEPRMMRRLVTLATPHHGTRIARLLDQPPVAQMRMDSAWLSLLNAQQEGRLAVPMTCVYCPDDELVAPARSAEFAGARPLPLAGCGHFGLLVSRRAVEQWLPALAEAP
jgi:pimeloyl-ACP methyl ester carboxylesterase